jgi:hypothetical protein
MTKIPWFSVWSDKYGVFADILSSLISDTYFDLQLIEVAQEIFDKNTYKENKHFLTGMFIKDYEIWKLLNTIPENEYFIFSDIDAIVFEEELYNYITPFLEKDNDIVFYKENDTNINVCFMLIKNTKKVKELYKMILDDHIDNPDECDGDVMNKILKRWNGKYDTFSPDYISSNINIIISNKNFASICVFQGSCTAFNNYKLNNLEKLLSFHYLFNLDLTFYIQSIINELNSDDKIILKKILKYYESDYFIKEPFTI